MHEGGHHSLTGNPRVDRFIQAVVYGMFKRVRKRLVTCLKLVDKVITFFRLRRRNVFFLVV